jgi:type I restriction enzyme S subunit
MIAAYPKVKLADCVDLLAGFAFKSQHFTDRSDDIPLVKGENVSQGCILWDISKRWSAADWSNLEKFQLRTGDVVVAMDRPWVPAGLKWAYIRRDDPKALLVQRCSRLRSNTPNLDQAFLRFVIGGPGFESYVKPITTGVNIPHISGKQILDYEFSLPPLPIQQRIAGILSAYDELIENNQRRIKILETMARNLYREWFVHFRFPGHENHPRVDSPLGEIPQGWEVGRLDDVLVLQRGFDLPKSSRTEGTVPIIAATGVTGFHNEAKVKAPGVVTGRSGTIGEVLYIQDDFWPLNTSLWVKAFPKGEPLYAYYLLSSLDLKQFNSGAAVPTLNRNDIHGVSVVIPPRDEQVRFQDIAGAMHTQSRMLKFKTENLRQTRDLLLPRLLSGQITLPEAADDLTQVTSHA